MIDVSVIIPTYGKPDNLYSAISSVLNQTYKNFELIVVDDNDPNSINRKLTEDLISQFNDKRLSYIKHSHNLNGATARNTGISHSKGKYIAFLDSDDEFVNNRIEKCLTALRKLDDSYAGVYTGCEFKKNKKTYKVFKNVKTGNYLIETLACSFMFCTGSNLFIKKDVVDELKGFDVNFLRHQDYEFLVRVFEKYSLFAINEILVIKNNDNKNLPNVEKMIDIKTKYLKKYHYLIDSLSTDDQCFVFYNQYIQIAEAAFRSNNKIVFRKYLTLAKKYKKISLFEYFRLFMFMLKIRS